MARSVCISMSFAPRHSGRALGLMKPLRWVLLASSVPVLVAFYISWYAAKDLLDNLAFSVAPQAGWCLFCLVWWGFWGPPRNRGLFFGGIVLADLLLLDLAFSNGDGLQWLRYLYFAPVAVVAGGFAGGLAGRLWLKPQLGASHLNGGPATRLERELMRQFIVRTSAMVIVQPFAMYLFLRVFECGFFVSAGLAAVATMLVGFGIYRIQSRRAARDGSS
jgi:hypothetical protein